MQVQIKWVIAIFHRTSVLRDNIDKTIIDYGGLHFI